MLKMRAGKVVFLGLSERNIELLKEGKPIAFGGADILLPGVEFVIFHGRTEMEMEQTLIKGGLPIPQ